MTDTFSTPAVIDADYIRALKLAGKKDEAEQLLAAYYKNKRDAKQQLARELLLQDAKKRYMLCKNLGICANCKVRDARDGLTTCSVCSDLKNKKKRD